MTKALKTGHITVSGIRKRSVARATVRPGTGIVRINKKPIKMFNSFQQLTLTEPLAIAEQIIKDRLKEIDIDVIVRGGGVESQIESSRLAIAVSYT
ncbi:MAG: 30S ribosomal protein S9, partial [Candidatus Pacearchaeota archaeon]|nr:30S ribosomal protein S9 [Candidatus Pacearchaeota archaeon]